MSPRSSSTRPQSAHPSGSARPKTVAVVAVFLFTAALMAAVVAFSLLFPNPLLDRMWRLNPAGAAFFRSVGPISGAFLLGLGAAMLAAARGLLRRRPWAWWFSAVLFLTEAVSNIVSYFLIHDGLRAATGFVISVALLSALCGRRVRDCLLTTK
jgi:hypothetical protein